MPARFSGRLNATVGIWVGVTLTAIGFALIFFAWARVAGLTNVAQQVPYVISGGLTGLALVIVGVTVVDVAVRRQDSHERHHQLAQTTRLLTELRHMLEDEERESSS